MLNIIISFDYEIFFGKNTQSIDSILFNTSNQIMDVMDAHSVKGTFFVDTLSYIKHKEIGNKEYCDKFMQQCINMLKRGHEAQLHIHAHWLKSEYDFIDEKWITDPCMYRLQAYDSNSIIKAIDDSISFLRLCGEQANMDYKCIAFRAGGLTLQPENQLIEMLIRRGIIYDSSIAPYTYSKISDAEYDYRQVPKKLNWKISPLLGLNTDAVNDDYILNEVPIATVKNNIFRIMKQKRPVRIFNSNPGGTCFFRNVRKCTYLERIKKKLFDFHWVSLDTRSASVIMSDLNTIYKKYNCEKKDYTVALIGHPKMFNQSHINNLVKLIIDLKNDNRYKIVLFRDLQENGGYEIV